MKILPNLSTWPLRKKLVSIIILCSMVCLLVSLSVLVGSSIFDRYKDSLQQLSGLANVLAENGQAALMFSDRAEAKRLLESLKNHNEISSAWLVMADATVLASWSRDGVVEAVPPDYKAGAKQIRSEFWSRRADFYLPVTRGTELIGYVLLKADFTERLESQLADLGKGVGGAALALFVVSLLASRMQRMISRPIAELADAARTISRDKAYGLRVPLRANDEIGDLVAAFNEMLGEIQERDENLILHRDRLEDEVSRRTAEMRTILENTPDTIARYDRNCRRIYVNPAFAALAEGGAAVLLGKKPSENPGGENSEIYEARINEVFETGRNVQFELNWSGKRGKEICSHIRLTAEYDLSGNVTSVLGVGRDITDRKMAEQNQNRLARALQLMSKCDSVLVRAEKEQELLTEICNLAVETGGYTMAWVGYAENNPARTVRPVAQSGNEQGYLEDANITWADTERGQGPAGKAIREGITVSVQDLQSNPQMTPWRDAAFKRGYKSCIALPLVINKKGVGMLAIYSTEPYAFGYEEVELLEELANDLSYGIQSLRTRVEHDAAEQALMKSMRLLEEKELAKTRFLAAAGHDLRQPLAAANLFIDALKFTDPSADQNEIIQRLNQAMINFNGLLDALLNVSKLDAGVIKPENSLIYVSEIFNWLEQSFAPMAQDKKLRFKLFFPMRETLVINSDIDLIKSILMNFVSNAIKYTSKGSILVSARRRGADVLFQVWDTGMGIEDENLSRIFDEFYQINNPQRDRTSGLGLGLAIAKRAISLLGGEVTCRSQIGRGSTFEFRLPLEKSQSEVSPQSVTDSKSEDVAQAELVRGKNIIVVEDDKLVAEALSKSMEVMGGKVLCFHSAEDALAYSNIEHADYYIADYMLGGAFNGIQFLNQLYKKVGKPINAVLMTGDTSPAFIREAANCDWPVLHKPVNISKLLSSLSLQGKSTNPSLNESTP